MNKVSIVSNCDNNYAVHLGVFLTSILKNANKDTFYDFIILDGGISKENKDKITSLNSINPNFSIRYIDMIGKYNDIYTHSYLNATVFYRLSIPELLTEYQKVLYLDVDMIIRGDLNDLYSTNTENYYLAAVKDAGIETSSNKDSLDNLEHIFKRPLDIILKSYFNAGMMLLNLDKLRKDNIMTDAHEFLIRESEKVQ